jgi:hypothetical protein
VALAALRNSAWAEDPRNFLRYTAASAAMHCADGKGADPPAANRPALRTQALDLLTADLAAVRKLPAADRAFAHEILGHRLLVDPDFASVRDPKALDRLPPAERDAWGKLWADARELRDRTAPPPGK